MTKHLKTTCLLLLISSMSFAQQAKTNSTKATITKTATAKNEEAETLKNKCKGNTKDNFVKLDSAKISSSNTKLKNKPVVTKVVIKN